MKEIKPVKIITLLGVIWFVTLLGIWFFDHKHQLDDIKDNNINGNTLIDERKMYEDALKKFELISPRKNNSRLGFQCEYYNYNF